MTKAGALAYLKKYTAGAVAAIVLSVVSIVPAHAASEVSLDYWWALNGPTYTVVSDQLFGLSHFRLWAATGCDDGAPCWQDAFVRIDYGVGTRGFTVYVGAEVLSHQRGSLSVSHAGPTAGARGVVRLSPSVDALWDVSVMPYDSASTPAGSGFGTGWYWSLGAAWKVSPSVDLAVGYRQFSFRLPTQAGSGSHEWLGPYAGMTVRF